MEATIDSLLADLERQIRLWHDIEPPNEAARRMTMQLTETIAAYARLRAEPALETPLADFAQTLRALRDMAETSTS